MQIIPSIFITSKEKFLEQTQAVANLVGLVHIDIADGQFVPSTTWTDPEVVARELKMGCELHLMVRNPAATILKWKTVPQVKRVIVHYESTSDLRSAIDTIHDSGWNVSIALKPETPWAVLEPFMTAIDGVMFMGVQPGAQGQPLVPEVLEKITTFKRKYPFVLTELDGGVNEQTLPMIVGSGVDAVCPGSAIFGNERTAEENLHRLRELIVSIDRGSVS